MYVNIWLQLYFFWALTQPIDQPIDDNDANNNINDSNALVVVVVFGVMQKLK